jgi:hypothetical protein
MHTTASLFVVLLALTADPLPTPQAGTLLSVKGTMTAVRGDSEGTKSFELNVLLDQVTPQGATAYWTLDEQGQGGWTWPSRFGRVDLDPSWRPVDGGQIPSLLYDRGDGKSQVPLVLPLLAAGPQPLAKDQAWESGKLDHKVLGSEKRAERDAWRVEARTAYGVKRTTWVATNSPVVVSIRERVFIGQGQEHELRIELATARQLSAAELNATKSGFESLLDLREKLNYEPRENAPQWNEKQLATLKAEERLAAKLGDFKLLATLARALDQDVRSQKGRSGAVASLREKAIGQSAPANWKLEGVGGVALDRDDLAGKVTILHFWEYRDTPLEEPYGQVGFLDFLHRQRQKGGVAVYGVSVHEAVDGDTGARRRATQAAGRLKSFMNLSYPLLVDDGAVLKKFGDPRVAGAKLPLWIVIDPTGKVVEYHAGHYEVQRDRGLEALDAIVTKALGKP